MKPRYIDANHQNITELIGRRAFKSREDIQEFIDNVPTANVLDISDNLEIIFHAAIRYSLGRATYVPSVVISYITPLLPYLSDKFLYVAKQDIEDRSMYGERAYGDPKIDKPEWDNFLSKIKQEIERRTNE